MGKALVAPARLGYNAVHDPCRAERFACPRAGSAKYLKGGGVMKKYECPCGYIYDPAIGDPDNGIAPGTAFEDIPDSWVCPVCGLGKDAFSEID